MTREELEKRAEEDGVSPEVEEFFESGKYAIMAMAVITALLALARAFAG